MPSRKTWKYLGIGFAGGVFGSAGLAIVAVTTIALWPSSPSTSGVDLTDIGCPSGMMENMRTAKCEMSEKTSASVQETARSLFCLGSK